ncbi:hypothetical protein EV356DRAFT_500874 [Viridothelium virens]|uniref:Uncharacterized protein n=1 Tax=Viridothelium virens TaxID=1048519 RepID=A0A6A6HAV2_VIRVR|nr:hypothetical protein EV356DRAFT_500874 [Viridothelium virens]
MPRSNPNTSSAAAQSSPSSSTRAEPSTISTLNLPHGLSLTTPTISPLSLSFPTSTAAHAVTPAAPASSSNPATKARYGVSSSAPSGSVSRSPTWQAGPGPNDRPPFSSSAPATYGGGGQQQAGSPAASRPELPTIQARTLDRGGTEMAENGRREETGEGRGEDKPKREWSYSLKRYVGTTERHERLGREF